jgi:hypothetical protein
MLKTLIFAHDSPLLVSRNLFRFQWNFNVFLGNRLHYLIETKTLNRDQNPKPRLVTWFTSKVLIYRESIKIDLI